MANNNNGEPSSAPQAERWYELKLGPSFRDNSPCKFCTLRYEFKPASIDKSQPGSLHKNKENRVAVEFNNNQPGKPKVSFEGSSEDYKDNDAVLFFDGETFRLERLHRAVKRLRHVRQRGESIAATANLASATSVKLPKQQHLQSMLRWKGLILANQRVQHLWPLISWGMGELSAIYPFQVQAQERLNATEGTKPTNRTMDFNPAPQNAHSLSPAPKLDDEAEENIDIDVDDDEEPQPKINTGEQPSSSYFGVDINIPTQHNDTDDEIADVDVSDGEAGKGPNAAEALRAQVNAEEGQQQKDDDEESSSSSGSSGSGSSGSGSGSGSSSSDSSDDDSASSAGDIDI
ncbi:LOW QUALITY PROTEIN: ELL-associated factor 2-like [Asparagus officinalis]|uniref:LOW QUALITY PROTEIN: ELL-associated factor 2-like n=1 Tax=Asparagus officinalis TaxID=4686 RepID=UPI00098E0265|nr:LOW QUALITY PROTEIN: ELL-associated factor 2-like [Asparagus officinalis]